MNTVAVAIFHGIGCRGRKYADGMIQRLSHRTKLLLKDATSRPTFVMKAIEWGHVVQPQQTQLCSRLKMGGRWPSLRRCLIDWVGDAIAYEPSLSDRSAFDAVQTTVASQLQELAARAGPEAPLCVIAHSFGSIIAMNYFGERQAAANCLHTPGELSHCTTDAASCPIVDGSSLATFITLGSPLALWTLRRGMSAPLRFPAPGFPRSRPQLNGLWLNIIGANDVLAYPISGLGFAPDESVIDFLVRPGGLLTGWNPLSHFEYWKDQVVAELIAAALMRLALDAYGVGGNDHQSEH